MPLRLSEERAGCVRDRAQGTGFAMSGLGLRLQVERFGVAEGEFRGLVCRRFGKSCRVHGSYSWRLTCWVEASFKPRRKRPSSRQTGKTLSFKVSSPQQRSG